MANKNKWKQDLTSKNNPLFTEVTYEQTMWLFKEDCGITKLCGARLDKHSLLCHIRKTKPLSHFHWIQIRPEMSGGKTCGCSHPYVDAKFSAFLPGTVLWIKWVSGHKNLLLKNFSTYCRENRICASFSPRTALPQQSRLFSGSSRTCFLLQKAFCKHTGELLVYISFPLYT